MGLKDKIFAMAIIVTLIASVGLLKYPAEIDKFLGLISTIWAGFLAAQLDLNKEK